MTGKSADFDRQNLPNHPIDIGSFRFAETSEASTQRALQPSFPSWHYPISYGFNVANLDRIIAMAKPANQASRRVIEKAGLKYEKQIHIFTLEVLYYSRYNESL